MLLLCVFFGFIITCNAQITKRINIDSRDIQRNKIVANGRVYERFMLKNAFFESDPGKPDLPVMSYKFFIPKGKKVSNVKFKPVVDISDYVDPTFQKPDTIQF